MDYVHIEDVVTGEIECSKVTVIPAGISEADMNAWFDELLIEDKKLIEPSVPLHSVFPLCSFSYFVTIHTPTSTPSAPPSGELLVLVACLKVTS